MADYTLVKGQVGNPPGIQGSGSNLALRQTHQGSLVTSHYEPDYYELARNGQIFTVTTTVAVAVAPLQVVPTTTAAFVLNNVDTSTSAKVLVPLTVSCYLGSGTADTGMSLFAQCTSTALATQLTANGTGVVMSNTRGSGTSIAYADSSKTVAGGWVCLGSIANAASTTPGVGITVDCKGLFIIKPTFALGLHVLSGAGTSAKFSYSVTWAEVAAPTP